MFSLSLIISFIVTPVVKCSLVTSVADPGSGAFLTPRSGMLKIKIWIREGKKSRFVSGMNIPDHISESLETIFWVKILKLFDADPGPDPGSGNLFDFGSGIRDRINSDPVSGINIPDPFEG
jgi:hypothetical protein